MRKKTNCVLPLRFFLSLALSFLRTRFLVIKKAVSTHTHTWGTSHMCSYPDDRPGLGPVIPSSSFHPSFHQLSVKVRDLPDISKTKVNLDGIHFHPLPSLLFSSLRFSPQKASARAPFFLEDNSLIDELLQ